MRQVNRPIAYFLWCACFLGICGLQRIYLGKVISGVLYLFTFGLFGVGQLVDLFLIPNLVRSRNATTLENLTPSSPELENVPTVLDGVTPMLKLLNAAKEKDGVLSLAQAAMLTELEPEPLKTLLEQAVREGYADIGNDPTTGAIRYRFDL
ncbi:TM2 domain-containing protein [Spirulina major]|uniref:TM2 domain-containing protein n=1 Tax=Spirulina major TaxID=270636 RepID=UPI000933F754|nr:TM2 domain-containing protein [Spirulina major]